MVARIFGACAPFVTKLGVYWPPLPMLVLGSPAVLSALLALMLPETKGKDLNDGDDTSDGDLEMKSSALDKPDIKNDHDPVVA